MPTSRRTPKTLHLDGLPTIHPNAAGIDIGADEIVVAVPPNRDPQPVPVFRTFSSDLVVLVTWLVECGIDTVALESTGVYWVPLYDQLEQHGITPFLVNARHVKSVPGRKSDWNDVQWLQKLHALGLLRAWFRLDAEIVALRTLVRYRAELIAHRAPHILHMQKALQQINLQLERVLSDIMGTTSSVQTIISEIGTDMSRFPNEKHFCAWLGLVPRNDISGGKLLCSGTMKVVNRATQAFRQAAQSVSRSDSALGA